MTVLPEVMSSMVATYLPSSLKVVVDEKVVESLLVTVEVDEKEVQLNSITDVVEKSENVM